ncbi:phage tail assembly chaperone family protein, TAC [Gilvimarinus agarilyticus]|uniref:phage tail assembly chaperone family protein, TAC n=1 Tax=Gilvimarinus agarilyticus TaxID=679259 RepID=UPI0005A1C0D4|nr:phage tail assembly chaperone family protein, TAC [Gilvimarinus agarilyticus]
MNALQQLQKLGGITSAETVRKTAKWKRGENDTLNIDVAIKKELSYGSFERITSAFANDDRARNARIVAEAVLLVDDDENELPITYATADAMKADLLMALKKAYDEVHNLPADAAEDAKPEEGEDTEKN